MTGHAEPDGTEREPAAAEGRTTRPAAGLVHAESDDAGGESAVEQGREAEPTAESTPAESDGAGRDSAADQAPKARPAARRDARPGRDPFGLDGRDLLPDLTGDERDGSWGDARGDGGDPSDLRRFLDEKPPHHF